MVRFERLGDDGPPAIPRSSSRSARIRSPTSATTPSPPSPTSCAPPPPPAIRPTIRTAPSSSPTQLSYPYAYERIAQLFDSPYAPDLVVSPKATPSACSPASTARSTSCSRARRSPSPAPASARALYDDAPRHVDIAPTICHLLGFPLDRRQRLERPHAPASAASRPTSTCSARTAACSTRSSTGERAPGARLPGRSSTASATASCSSCSSSDDPRVANLRRMLDRSARFRYGSTVNFPTHHLAEPQRHLHRRLVRPPRHRQPDLLRARRAPAARAAGAGR